MKSENLEELNFFSRKKGEPSHDILTQKVQNLKSFTDSIH